MPITINLSSGDIFVGALQITSQMKKGLYATVYIMIINSQIEIHIYATVYIMIINSQIEIHI